MCISILHQKGKNFQILGERLIIWTNEGQSTVDKEEKKNTPKGI